MLENPIPRPRIVDPASGLLADAPPAYGLNLFPDGAERVDVIGVRLSPLRLLVELSALHDAQVSFSDQRVHHRHVFA